MTKSPLNVPMAVAATLTALGCVVHIFLGTGDILNPVLASTLDPTVQAVMAVVWHAISALLFIFAIGLAWLSRHANTPLALVLISLNLSFVVLFLAYGVLLLGTVWPMPQWILFGAISAAMGWGMLRAQSAAG